LPLRAAPAPRNAGRDYFSPAISAFTARNVINITPVIEK
jgi:hypothetical protein